MSGMSSTGGGLSRRRFLGVGAAVDTPVAYQGRVEIRPRMQLTLAADHRILDGATAARFLQDVKAGIEDPALLIL